MRFTALFVGLILLPILVPANPAQADLLATFDVKNHQGESLNLRVEFGRTIGGAIIAQVFFAGSTTPHCISAVRRAQDGSRTFDCSFRGRMIEVRVTRNQGRFVFTATGPGISMGGVLCRRQ